MRAVAFVVVAPWVMSFLFFGWRTWATWPSKQERKRQRDVSKLYVYHFDERRCQSYGDAQLTPIPEPLGGSSTFFNRRQRTYSQPVA